MSRCVASQVLTHMMVGGNLAITGGRTPKRMYEMLVPIVQTLKLPSNTIFYNFDEIPYKNKDQEGITISDLRRYFFTPAKVAENHIHVLSQHNYKRHDEMLQERGGLDLIVLGLGTDGHYCGNLPHTTIYSDETVKVPISEDMKNMLAVSFEHGDDIPDYYITMGPKSVMNSKKIIMIASGNEKAAIIKRLLDGEVSIDVPASLLMLHPNFYLIVDADAASLLSQETCRKYQ